nr:integrase, catalytic region, zinc finger, CCHC-type, peptidase aspartic, catalytic [Tanacetum cinerariifolium]
LPRFCLKWSPSGRIFDLKGKLVASKETNYPNDNKACPSNPQEPIRKRFPNSTVFLGRLSKFCLWCVDLGCSKHMTGNIKLLINFVWKFLGTVCFGNDHIAAILGYGGGLKWGNITITRV